MNLLRSILSGSALLALSAGCLLALLATAGAAEPFKAGSYQEELQLTWGKVTVADDGNRTRDSWYATQAPSFTQENVFDAEERALLSGAFDRATRALVNGHPVWRIDTPSLNAFRAAVEKSAQLTLSSMGSPPKVLVKGSAPSRKWTLDLDWSRPAVNAPPDVEVALQVAGIPPGEAVHVVPGEALNQALITGNIGLSADDRAAIVAGAQWMEIFLVAPGTLVDGSFPTIKEATPDEMTEYAIPIGYGLRALGQVGRVLGADPGRIYSDEHTKSLEDCLSGQHMFADTKQWFPQVGLPGDLDGADVNTNPLAALVVVRHPDPDGKFMAKRVQRDGEWVILAGPFPRMTKVAAVVGFIAGEKSLHAVADLPKLISDEKLRQHYDNDLKKLNEDLKAAVDRYKMQDGNFFWRERVKAKHAKVMREMENVSFISKVSAEFDETGVTYTATYTPAKIEGKVGLSTDPEHGFGSTGEVTWTGLIKPSDTFSLSVSATPKSVDGTLNYRVMLYRDDERRKFHWLSIPIRANKDEHFLLNDLFAQPFANQTFSGGAQHEYDVKPVRPKGDDQELWNATLKTGLLVESFRLTAAGIPSAIRDAGLLLRHVEVWTFHPASAKDARVVWEHEVSPTLTWAPRIGWDSAFGAAEIIETSTAKFGGDPGVQEDALYTSFQVAIGMSTGRLPAAYRFRFGDVNRLPGLEPGEFSGRSYAHGQLICGANLGYLFGRIFSGSKKQSDDKSDANADSGPPPALAQMNLELLAEFGSLSTTRGFGIFAQGHTDVSSYGLSLRKAASDPKSTGVRVGYAWSPEGMHRHGRFFMSADMKF